MELPWSHLTCIIRSVFFHLIFSSVIYKYSLAEIVVSVDKNVIFSKLGDSVGMRYKLEDNSGGTLPLPQDNSKIELGVELNSTYTRLVTIQLSTSFDANVIYDPVNGDSVRQSYDGRIEVTFQNNEVAFQLNNIMLSDFGRSYILEYRYTDFKRAKNTIQLTKAVKPVIQRTSFFPKASQILGSNRDYICIADGKPQPRVEWLRKSEMKAAGQGKATLPIKNAQKEDSDVFFCRASNEGGETKKSMTLTVSFIKLNDGVALKRISVTRGGTIKETCAVNGYPEPTYKWLNPGNKVIESEKQLTFNNNKDFGNYSCEATNDAGTVRYIVQVDQKEGASTTAATAKGDGETSGGKFIEASLFIVFIIYLLSILSMGLL